MLWFLAGHTAVGFVLGLYCRTRALIAATFLTVPLNAGLCLANGWSFGRSVTYLVFALTALQLSYLAGFSVVVRIHMTSRDHNQNEADRG
jgi:hypothetical protein